MSSRLELAFARCERQLKYWLECVWAVVGWLVGWLDARRWGLGWSAVVDHREHGAQCEWYLDFKLVLRGWYCTVLLCECINTSDRSCEMPSGRTTGSALCRAWTGRP